ncbi:MAG: hypothetical protein ACFFDT_23405 [Candidatus Hodarchaeota archaeon]
MMSALDRTVDKLGEGEILTLDSGETIFKLSSFKNNPIITPQNQGVTWIENGELKIGAVFNGGAEILQDDKIISMPRCPQRYQKRKVFDKMLGMKITILENYISEIWPLISEDGVNFTRFQKWSLRGDGVDHHDFLFGIEDIRIIRYQQNYLLIGCGRIKPPFKDDIYGDGDRTAIYSTDNFDQIVYHGIITPFWARNTIPFPELITGQQYCLLRFFPNIYLVVLEGGIDQLLNPTQYKDEWERIYQQRERNLLLKAGKFLHERERIGPGPQVVKTETGWLFIYHATGEININVGKVYGLREKVERAYSICVALLDLENPRKILCRVKYPIYVPSFPYELYGNELFPVDIPAVVFPTGAIVRKDKLLLYAGAGDKYMILLSCKLDNLIDYLWKYCKINEEL